MSKHEGNFIPPSAFTTTFLLADILDMQLLAFLALLGLGLARPMEGPSQPSSEQEASSGQGPSSVQGPSSALGAPSSQEQGNVPIEPDAPPPPPHVQLPEVPQGYPSRLISFGTPQHFPTIDLDVVVGFEGLDGADYTFHEAGRELQLTNLYGQAGLLIRGTSPRNIVYTVGARFALNNPRPVYDAIMAAWYLSGDDRSRITAVTTIVPTLGNRNNFAQVMTDWVDDFQHDLFFHLPYTEPSAPMPYDFRPITVDDGDRIVDVASFTTTPVFRQTGQPEDLYGDIRQTPIGSGFMAPLPPRVPDPPTPPGGASSAGQLSQGGGFWACLSKPFSCCCKGEESSSGDDPGVEMVGLGLGRLKTREKQPRR